MRITHLKIRLALAILTFSLILLSRLFLLDDIEFDTDEVWAVWSSQGTIPEVIARVPYDWPPFHALTLWLWQSLVGIHPYTGRISSIFLSFIAYAGLFQFSLDCLKQERSAWIAVIAFAAMGYAITLSTFVRGYALMQPLFVFACIFCLQYFRHQRLRDGILLALMMAGLFYTNLTAILSFLVLGLLSLLIAPKRILAWWLPGILAFVLALPEVLNKLNLAATRSIGELPLEPTFLDNMRLLYGDFLGDFWLAAFVLLIVFLLAYLFKNRRWTWQLSFLLLWTFAFSIAFYLSYEQLGFFSVRHLWWIMLGIALLFAYLLKSLPKSLSLVFAILCLSAMFFTSRVPTIRGFVAPMEEQFPQLREYLQAGDVFLLDPQCDCSEAVRWDYYLQVYFPEGLHFVDSPEGYSRVWYIYNISNVSPMLAIMEEGRIAGKFFGPPGFFIRLYEAPPDPEGILYDNGMRFHGMTVVDSPNLSTYPILRPEGSSLRLRLWWSIDIAQSHDYSISVQLWDSSGRIISQVDSAPQLIQLNPTDPRQPPQETSRWQIGEYYVEERELLIPNPTSSGDYQLFLILYQWWDGERIASEATNEDKLMPLDIISVMSW